MAQPPALTEGRRAVGGVAIGSGRASGRLGVAHDCGNWF